jgi:acyl-CoA synthetase (AMP-forming)/AMP-acid ligase II
VSALLDIVLPHETDLNVSGLASPVNDLAIVKDGVVVPPGVVGEVWIKGPNVMQCYWNDTAATDKVSLSHYLLLKAMTKPSFQALTKDGWLRSGDLGYLDEEGFLYIRDRSGPFVYLTRQGLKIGLTLFRSQGHHHSWRRKHRECGSTAN